MSDSLEITESQSAANATAPRVTLDSMKEKIVKQVYLTHEHLTICILEMQNGFFVVGEAAPASLANFDAELGRQFSFENAIRQLWKLEGYAKKWLMLGAWPKPKQPALREQLSKTGE